MSCRDDCAVFLSSPLQGQWRGAQPKGEFSAVDSIVIQSGQRVEDRHYRHGARAVQGTLHVHIVRHSILLCSMIQYIIV
jgi:hypothetical protein